MRTRLFVAIGLAVCLALVPGLALAHHPVVSGEQDCDGTLTYTVRAWNGKTDASRTNPDVRVKVDGVLVQTGAFTKENGFQFSGTVELGAPRTVVVWAKAFADWGNGTAPGEARQVTVYPPEDCPPPSSSTSTPGSSTSTPTTAGPTTTVPPTTPPTSGTAAPTSTMAPTTTAGQTTTTAAVPPSTVAPTTIAQPTTTVEDGGLPFTGANAVPLLLTGLVLLAGGYLALRFGRRHAQRSD
jgi:hypothetical protein